MSTQFLVRPSSEKETFRIKLTAASLLGLKLKPGDLCCLTLKSEQAANNNQDEDQKLAIASEASGSGMKDNVVQTSKFLQDLYGFRLGDKVEIERVNEVLQDATNVQLEPTGQHRTVEHMRLFWEAYAKLTVRSDWDCLARGQSLSFKVGREEQVFRIRDLGVSGNTLGKIGDETAFIVVQPISGDNNQVNFEAKRLGGVDKEAAEVQLLIDRLLKPRIPKSYSPIQGILIYGAKGVGKTAFINALSNSGWTSVIRWVPGVKLVAPRSPTLIVIDQLDLPSSNSSSNHLLRELDKLFSLIKGTPSLVVGETKHPNDVNAYLRSEGKFAAEIEIPIPTAVQRKSILLALRGEEPIPDTATLQIIADRTHGYVAADLTSLLRRILELSSEHPDRQLTNGAVSTPETTDATASAALSITPSDIDTALRQIRPSALQEIFLSTPTVHWTDIGGMHTIKRTLINAVTRPLTMADKMAKLALRPTRGILLYGPPGCSKTLLVKALACEAGLNFLAVKGAELISMYVGESERATREIFRKARAASPSIVFFDEIDAIASRGRGSSGGGSDGLNVLTTLLNEMDGFEELKNVLVVAATNKPEQLDPALLRPGRFDEVVYIGLPDVETRTEILANWFGKSNYIPGKMREGLGEGEGRKLIRDDAEEFAGRMDGFSGAEVVSICQRAAEGALDDGERDWYGWTDVEEAMKRTPRSVTKEMMSGFEGWNAARMR